MSSHAYLKKFGDTNGELSRKCFKIINKMLKITLFKLI